MAEPNLPERLGLPALSQSLRRHARALPFTLLAASFILWPVFRSIAQDKTASAPTKSHWAFQPLRPINPPATRDHTWPRTAIDRFILADIEKAGLTPAKPASREQLLRRVSFGLTGLPPSLAELDSFLADSSAEAFPRIVDRLLASPHYGERWARHWLDLARFGESDGFEHDTVRSNAWRYRDYVVRSFNRDKPYDQFVIEQIAGDLLSPNDPDALTATGFNLLGPDMVDSADQVQRRLNSLNDITDVVGQVFLGLTLGCARCHDHKFEPLTQRDYYRMQAFFTPARFERALPIATAEERSTNQRAQEDYRHRTEPLRQELTQLRERYAPAQGQKKPKEADLLKAMSPEDRQRHKELESQLAAVPKPAPLPNALGLAEGSPTNTYILIRGDYNRPGDVVSAGTPAVLGETASGKTNRVGLAQWIVSPDNPLAARVMVNRVWQHHFGQGLVRTPSDFGVNGEPPTHPELLDWLAGEFIREGWSLKKLHRLIVLSAVYQQASAASPRAQEIDPNNLLLSHRDKLRLEGEVIRDSLLEISGRMNPQMGGPGVFPPIPTEMFRGANAWEVSANARDHGRRSIYIFCRRNFRFPFLEVFDAPDNNLSCPVRPASTTAPQALTLLNAGEVMTAAETTATMLSTRFSQPNDQVTQLYRLALNRTPTSEEQKRCLDFLEHSPLRELCRAVFNLNAFVYVD